MNKICLLVELPSATVRVSFDMIVAHAGSGSMTAKLRPLALHMAVLVSFFFLTSYARADAKPPAQDGASFEKASENLRAFQGKDPKVVRIAIHGLYAVLAIGLMAVAMLFLGWAKYHSPKYWQQSDRQTELNRKTPLPRKTQGESSIDDRDKFDLEGDIYDLVRRIDRNKTQ